MKSVCRLDVASRIGHFLLTFFVLYVTLSHPNSVLHKSWESNEHSFFILLGLLTLSLLLYLISSLLDPGYLPRPQLTFNPPATEAKYKIKPGESTAIELESPSSPAASVNEGRMVKEMRFCRVCSLSQPLRSRHCHQCGRCVRRFDHHCPWLGNCVGERNHRFFWLFLGTETALLAWAVWITWNTLVVGGDTLEWLRANVVLLLCLLLEGVAWCVASLLFLYHSYLVLTGQTTWEHASYHRIPYLSALLSNPFDEGCCCNLVRFMCVASPRDWEEVYGDRTGGSP